MESSSAAAKKMDFPVVQSVPSPASDPKVDIDPILPEDDMVIKRRKELFGDCALIEIIHLHDCLRGALNALRKDVHALAAQIQQENAPIELVADLERRVSGRFKVIWSVFRAHSSAEDEFIWPVLQAKTQGKIRGSPPRQQPGEETNAEGELVVAESEANDVIEQEEYEEDHADEERMFSQVDTILCKLREVLLQWRDEDEKKTSTEPLMSALPLDQISQEMREQTNRLARHLMEHLDKEEQQCLPLVIKHLSKAEIHELVGNIMGKRSADTIAQIMTMAVQNLDEEDRMEMVKYMKQSMAGTFFDRWLLMSGWMSETSTTDGAKKRPSASSSTCENTDSKQKYKRTEEKTTTLGAGISHTVPSGVSITSQAELEKLIRAIATNHALTAEQKNTTIQGLRDSVWKSNQREKEKRLTEDQPTVVNETRANGRAFLCQPTSTKGISLASSHVTSTSSTVAACTSSRTRRVTPPSVYFKKNEEGKLEMVWSTETSLRLPEDGTVPLFSAAELAPTYHDGAAGTVLGCPHYARACKLRHPKSGRLYTCRLCCEQEREMPMKDQDEPLDRYAVTEVMCIKCTALQPAEDRCINADCESRGRPFAKYFCRICHLYDDGSRPIFHCPYCNTCRLGLGLGIDFRHCMRCNACVSLADDAHHCIPQKLQGSCPICRDTLFQSTEPLRGLKCGHVMHLSCFTQYRRGHAYTCPLCMRSMEDMNDYFSLLDAAVRMQPMPTAYLSTLSNIYCQDCDRTGQVQYHFVGQKCLECGSYNTREMGRVHNSPTSTPPPQP
jgi:hypothetical protein